MTDNAQPTPLGAPTRAVAYAPPLNAVDRSGESTTVARGPGIRGRAVPFACPLIGEEEINEVVDTLRSNWITTGPKTARFESEFGSYLSAPGALALNPCTGAMHTALAILGLDRRMSELVEQDPLAKVPADRQKKLVELWEAVVDARVSPRQRVCRRRLRWWRTLAAGTARIFTSMSDNRVGWCVSC